jgi:hypothetical protein
MLAWLWTRLLALFAAIKAKHVNMQKAMLYQNSAAADALAEFYATHWNPTEAAAMRRLGNINRGVAAAFDGRTSLPNQHLRTMLAVNKELRRHDRHLFGDTHFDEAYRPDGDRKGFHATFPEA